MSRRARSGICPLLLSSSLGRRSLPSWTILSARAHAEDQPRAVGEQLVAEEELIRRGRHAGLKLVLAAGVQLEAEQDVPARVEGVQQLDPGGHPPAQVAGHGLAYRQPPALRAE